MANKRANQHSYNYPYSTNDHPLTSNNPIQSSSPAFSPAPETPLSAGGGGYYSPVNPNQSILLPSSSTSTTTTTNNNNNRQPNSSSTNTHRRRSRNSNHQSHPSKRRKNSSLKDPSHPTPSSSSSQPLPSSRLEDRFQLETSTSPTAHHHHHHHHHHHSKEENNELDLDQEEEENRKELDDDDYTVRKREDLINKDKLKTLLEHFDTQQMDRYIEYRNSGLAKANIRKLANSILQQSVSDRVTIAIRGLAKVFVGHMVEEAIEVQKRRGNGSLGPLTQSDLKEAYRNFLNERDRGGSDRRKMFIK